MTWSIRLQEKPALQGRTEHLSDSYFEPVPAESYDTKYLCIITYWVQSCYRRVPSDTVKYLKEKRQPQNLKVYLWQINLPWLTEE